MMEVVAPLNPIAQGARAFANAMGWMPKQVGKFASTKVSRAFDQDVNIADQDQPVDINSAELENLMDKTNDLVNKTNQLLADISSTLEKSITGMDQLDYSIDDLVATTSGKSISDVRSRQGMHLSPEKVPELGDEMTKPREAKPERS